MKLNDVLKSLRIDHDLTQQDIADTLGISRARYSNYEQGTRLPDYEILLSIVKFYNISLDSIFGIDNKEKTNLFKDTQIFKSKLHEEIHKKIDLISDDDLLLIKTVLDRCKTVEHTKEKRLSN